MSMIFEKPITFNEFKKLPKSKPENNLEPGKRYYIKKTGSVEEYTEVLIGTFERKSDFSSYIFRDVAFVVAPFGATRKLPDTFLSKDYEFMEVFDLPEVFEPTEENIRNKNKSIVELSDYIEEKKLEPHNAPTISFFGQEYRKAMGNYYSNGSGGKTKKRLLRKGKKSRKSRKSRKSNKSKKRKGRKM